MAARIFIECPTCAFGAEMAADAAGRQATCRRCGAKFTVRSLAPEPDGDIEAPRDCPACDDERLQRAEGAVGVFECQGCHGGFLTAPALETLALDGQRLDPQVVAELETATARDPVACPACSTRATHVTLERFDR